MKIIPNPSELLAWDGKQKLRGVRDGWTPTEEQPEPPSTAYEPVSLARVLRQIVLTMAVKELTLADTQHGQKCLRAFDEADGHIELEDADYAWLKPVIEREAPKAWGFNAPGIVEAFAENGQVESRADRRRKR